MSNRTARSILTGLALVTTLTVTLPGSTEAAGFSPTLRGGDVVSQVWHWLSDLWTGKAHVTSAPSTSTGGGAPSSSAACGGDQGVCIDPNG